MKADTTSSQKRLLKRNAMASHVLLACLSMTGGLISTPVMAQQANTSANKVQALEDIVVTARKRDEKLLEVPISVLAYSEKELKASGTTSLYDLQSTAGFTFTQYAGNGSGGRTSGVLVFRGLQGSTALPQDNSGSLFIDGIFISAGMASIGTTDVARVEVLKGPQNAYFGRSTFGGAVNFITKNPSDVFQGEINASTNTRGSLDLNATIEGPLVNNMLKGRLTLTSHNKAATYTASDGGDLGAEKSKAISGTLYATPTDKLWVRGRVNYQEDNDSQATSAFITGIGNTSCVGQTFTHQTATGADVTYTPGVGYFCGTIPTLKQLGTSVIDVNTTLEPLIRQTLLSNNVQNPYLSSAPRLDHTGLRRNALRGSLQAGYDLPYNTDWVVNLGYNQSKSTAAYDTDRTANRTYQNINVILTNDFTFDTRLSSDKNLPLRGVFGVSYFRQSNQGTQIDLNFPLQATSVVASNSFSSGNSHVQVPAVYGSIEYDLLKNLTATFDLRRQRDKIIVGTFLATTPMAGGLNYTSEKTNNLPRLTLKYQYDPDTNFYVTASKGVQPLSLNSSFLGLSALAKAYVQSIFPQLSDSFSPQPKLDNREIGLKQKLFNNRLQYSVTAYRSKWTDRLTSSFVFNPASCNTAGPGGTPVAGTAACPLGASGSGVLIGNNALIKGIEFSADALVVPNWTAGLSLDYKEAKWTQYNNGGQSSRSTPPVANTLNFSAQNFNGNYIQWVPKLTAALNSTYRVPNLVNNWNGFVRGDVIYNSGAWESDFNYSKTDGSYRVNLRAGMERNDLSLELFVLNAFNDTHLVTATRTTDIRFQTSNFLDQGLLLQPSDPREFGIRLSYKFN